MEAGIKKTGWQSIMSKASYLFTDRSLPVHETLNRIGGSILFLLTGLVFVDIILRYIFNKPIRGTYEIVEIMMVVIVFFAIGLAQIYKRHIVIDFTIEKFPTKARIVLDNVINFLNVTIYGVIFWRSILYAVNNFHFKSTLQTIRWPVYIFAFIVVLGFALFLCLLIGECYKTIQKGIKLKLGWRVWLASFGILIVVIAAAIIVMQPHLINMGKASSVGIIAMVVMVFLFFWGLPVATTLFITSLIFMIHLAGFQASVSSVGMIVFRSIANYTWAVIGFFILMGYIIFYSGLGKDLFYAAYKWLGRIHGGLALAVVGACTAMAACVGDAMSSTVTMGTVALPELRKYKYDEKLSVGSICAGATLGPLIPPSMGFVLYGLITGVSIGDLFIAGIFPGLLLALAYMAYIYFMCRRNPALGPQGPKTGLREKMVSLNAGWPVAILFVLIIGGIYGGVFTPTEGGAIGAFTAFIIALVMRRLNINKFFNAVKDAGILIGSLFLLVIGAMMFGYLVAWSKLPDLLNSIIVGMNVHPIVIVLVMLLIYFILGCFIDGAVVILIIVPIFYPITETLGIDPIWFGVLTMVLVNLGMITPPFGIIMFGLRATVGDLSLGTIYRGSAPFVFITIIVIAILMAFPQISTFLPYFLK